MDSFRRGIAAQVTDRLPRPVRRGLRVVLLALLVVILLFGLFRAAAPFLVQTAVVRTGIERAIAQWTGHDVTIEGSPTIIFWPQPRIEVDRVTVSKASPDGVRLLSRTRKLSAEFSLYQALRGRAVFEDFRLIEPEIFVTRDEEGRLDWAEDGLLSEATRNVAASGPQRVLDPMLDRRVGDIAVENGRIEIEDAKSGRTWRAIGINGAIQWPRLSGAAAIRATAQVAGQDLQLNLSSPEPLALLSGASAPVEGDLASALVSGRFQGSAHLAHYGFVSGSLALSSSDAAALAAWMGSDMPLFHSMKEFALNAQIITTGDAVRFDQMQLTLNGSTGSGIVDFSLAPANTARLTGTVAFDRVDLPALLRVVSATSEETFSIAGQSALDLDLRISAQEAAAGPLTLDSTAISIVNKREGARFDILDGTVAGGRITGQLVGSQDGFASGGKVSVSLRDADLAELSERLGLKGPFPMARGSIEADLSFPGASPVVDLSDVSGDLRIATGPGILPDVNPSVILQRVGTQTYSPLLNPEGEDFEYQKLDVAARLTDGVAQIASAKIESADGGIDLTGVVSRRGGLALSARIENASPAGPRGRIFIGGSWPDPVAIEIP